jgi:hypothetical protein
MISPPALSNGGGFSISDATAQARERSLHFICGVRRHIDHLRRTLATLLALNGSIKLGREAIIAHDTNAISFGL